MMQSESRKASGSKARDRAVSFSKDEEKILAKKSSKSRNDGPNSGRQAEKTRVTENGNSIRLDLTGKLDKTFHMQKSHGGKEVWNLCLKSNHITDIFASLQGPVLHLQIHPSDNVLDIKLNMSRMLELDLSQNRLTSFLPVSVLSCMPKLKRLFMYNNHIGMLASESILKLAEFGEIEELNLGTNELQQLPPEIGQLLSLRKLNLSHNKLVALPPEIVELTHLYDSLDAFNIADNRLVQPQQAIAQQGGLEWIRTYFLMSTTTGEVPTSERYYFHLVMSQLNHGRKAGGAAPGTGVRTKRSLQLKLLVVGRDGAGKTLLIKKLKDAQNHVHRGGDTPVAANAPLRAFSEDAAQGAFSTPGREKAASRSGFKLDTPGAVTSPTAASTAAAAGLQGFTSPTSADSRPSTPNTCHSNSYTPGKTDTCDLGCLITSWYPKKGYLDKFVFRRAPENKKSAKSLFTVEPDDIKFTIWNFVGKWMFHTVHEIFFSTSALHMVVFDLNLTANEHDCDRNVQYWIDLIQARAPGSSIIVVATHADEIGNDQEEQRRLDMVDKRLKYNEVLRVADLKKDIEYCRDPDKQAAFRLLLNKRPVIDEHIIALRSSDVESVVHYEMMCLSVRIVQLATPTKDTPHPFATINVPLPDFFWHVKETIKVLREQGKQFCTLKELDQHILERHALGGAAKHSNKFILSGTRVALTHWSSVGEVLWFNFDNKRTTTMSGEKSAQVDPAELPDEDKERSFQPLTRSLTGDFGPTSTPQESPLDASDVIFLDPDWLMGCIKTILDQGLILDIQTVDHYHCVKDDESARADRTLNMNKEIAKRGIIKWEYIRSYLERRGYDQKILDVVRVVLEKFNVIIPIRTEQKLSQSQSQGVSSASGTAPPAITRHRTEPTLIPPMPPTPIAKQGHARGFTSPGVSSALTGMIAASVPQFERVINSRAAIGQQYYLIPSLLVRYEYTPPVVASGRITLERSFHFNRFTPPGLIQTIFSRIYAFQEDQPLTSVDGSTPNVCWDRAFVQQHGHIKILVHLAMAATSDAHGVQLEEGGSQDLCIKGTGHMLNAHIILEHLDKYTKITQQVLEEYPGLGHVRLSSTCPSCMLNQPDERMRGEFRHSELVILEQTFRELTDFLMDVPKGGIDRDMRAQLRKWNSKRHTCPKNRTHQVKSELLIHVPRPLKAEIERASHAEKEVHFLLDEVVRSAAVPTSELTKGVVKVMAANCRQGHTAFVKGTLVNAEEGADLVVTVNIEAVEFSSGVVVPLPEGHPMTAVLPNPERTNEVLVLACEHVLTRDTLKEGKYVYSRKGEMDGAEAVFLIGDATQWLYLAEMVFQGSTHEGSDSNFWDFCALRIVAPIVPVQQTKETVLSVQVLVRGPSQFGLETSTSIMSIDTTDMGERVDLQHPELKGSPLHSIPVATHTVCVDQVVRRMGYPNYPRMMGISVDWGRVEQIDPNGDILISLLSDNGASGGPILDREGRLIGLLSRSHDLIKLSCVQQLRNLFDLLSLLPDL